MTEDFRKAERWQELPKGMPEMAALITRGSSFIGYKPQRDGIPEVVVRAYARVGPEGLTAIGRLAYGMTPTPKLEAAAALCEWGIEHYVGHRKAMKGDGLQPEGDARGQLLRMHVMNTWGKEIPATGAPADWADWVDWPQAAANNEAEGKVTFTEHQNKDTGETEVDMFAGEWKAAQ